MPIAEMSESILAKIIPIMPNGWIKRSIEINRTKVAMLSRWSNFLGISVNLEFITDLKIDCPSMSAIETENTCEKKTESIYFGKNILKRRGAVII